MEITGVSEWTWNDVWILMALYLAQGQTGAELHAVIGAADAINHAIPTSCELSRAFTKFVRCGLLSVAEDRYAILSEFLPTIRKAYEGKGGLFASGDKGLKWLQRWKLVESADQNIEINDAAVKAAYTRYVNALKKK